MRGTRVPIAASTAKVPLPWIGTQTWLPVPLAMATRRSQTLAVRALKLPSQEPQSVIIAARVRSDVVSGPGVRRMGAAVMVILPDLPEALRDR